MLVVNLDIDLIYSPKTREYFEEVLSSFGNGNYRSSIVMLYSVVICDLLFKLQEIRDQYSDKVADSILKSISNSNNSVIYNLDSKWEKDLIESIRKQTTLLDNQTYINLIHLRDDRNLSAHPAFNSDFELVVPTREKTIAYIKSIYKDILIKPPIFISKIVDLLTEDLEAKKEIYITDYSQLNRYLINKYFSRMSLPIYLSTLKAFWKFCFISNDDNCKVNRRINRLALVSMFEYNFHEALKLIGENKNFFVCSEEIQCKVNIILFLSRSPKVYGILNEDVKYIIERHLETDINCKLVSWFTEPNKKIHIENFCQNNDYLNNQIDENYIDFAIKMYQESDMETEILDFIIEYFGKSKNFNTADSRFEKWIKPHINLFSQDQCIKLLNRIDTNNQIYGRGLSYSCNTLLVSNWLNILGNNFNFSQYKNFRFDQDILDDKSLKQS